MNKKLVIVAALVFAAAGLMLSSVKAQDATDNSVTNSDNSATMNADNSAMNPDNSVTNGAAQ